MFFGTNFLYTKPYMYDRKLFVIIQANHNYLTS